MDETEQMPSTPGIELAPATAPAREPRKQVRRRGKAKRVAQRVAKPPRPSTSPLADIPAEEMREQEPEVAAVRADGDPLVRRDPNRPLFGQRKPRLAVPERPGFVRHWFNEVPGRIDLAMSVGYAHVKDRTGKPVQTNVGTGERGGGLLAFLMEIPRQFYDEDFAAKQAGPDEVDRALKRGDYKTEPGDRRYVAGPKSGIPENSFDVTRGRDPIGRR